MKTINSKNIVRSLAALALASLGTSAFAASTWGFTTSGCGVADSSLNNSISCAVDAGAAAVTVTAFSVGTSVGATYAGAKVGVYGGGLGVSYTGELTGTPQHTVDNSTQTDLLLLNFGNFTVDLDAIKIGYKADSVGGSNTSTSDADISVFRYTGGSLAPTVTATTTTANLLSNGWTLVGNYADLAVGTDKVVNKGSPADTKSSWWLISAYNTNFGTVASVSGDNQGTTVGAGATTGLQNGNDYFKVLSVTGTATRRVPEPDSLLLFGAGLLGLMAARRRKPAALTA